MHIFDAFIPSAYAESVNPAVTAPNGGGMSIFVMFFIFFIFLYFAVWRPQNKRAREQQNLMASLAKGDEVLTSSGIIGRIVKLQEQYVTLAINEQSEVLLQKSAIVSVLPKGTWKSMQ